MFIEASFRLVAVDCSNVEIGIFLSLCRNATVNYRSQQITNLV